MGSRCMSDERSRRSDGVADPAVVRGYAVLARGLCSDGASWRTCPAGGLSGPLRWRRPRLPAFSVYLLPVRTYGSGANSKSV